MSTMTSLPLKRTSLMSQVCQSSKLQYCCTIITVGWRCSFHRNRNAKTQAGFRAYKSLQLLLAGLQPYIIPVLQVSHHVLGGGVEMNLLQVVLAPVE